MGIAAMILGILGAVIALTPCIGMAALIPAPIGLILGIVDVILKKKNRLPIGMGIAGIVLNMVAIAFAIFWIFILGTRQSQRMLRKPIDLILYTKFVNESFLFNLTPSQSYHVFYI